MSPRCRRPGIKKAGSSALLFLCPFVWEEIPEGFRRCSVGQLGAAVKDVREVLEEVDPMQSAGTGQGVEDGTALRPGMAAEEQGVLPGEGDIAVDALNEVIVPGVVATFL